MTTKAPPPVEPDKKKKDLFPVNLTIGSADPEWLDKHEDAMLGVIATAIAKYAGRQSENLVGTVVIAEGMFGKRTAVCPPKVARPRKPK